MKEQEKKPSEPTIYQIDPYKPSHSRSRRDAAGRICKPRPSVPVGKMRPKERRQFLSEMKMFHLELQVEAGEAVASLRPSDREHGWWEYEPGTVFSAPHHSSAHPGGVPVDDPHRTVTQFGCVFSKFRKFVVLHQYPGSTHCGCLPVYTHEGRGLEGVRRPEEWVALRDLADRNPPPAESEHGTVWCRMDPERGAVGPVRGRSNIHLTEVYSHYYRDHATIEGYLPAEEFARLYDLARWVMFPEQPSPALSGWGGRREREYELGGGGGRHYEGEYEDGEDEEWLAMDKDLETPAWPRMGDGKSFSFSKTGRKEFCFPGLLDETKSKQTIHPSARAEEVSSPSLTTAESKQAARLSTTRGEEMPPPPLPTSSKEKEEDINRPTSPSEAASTTPSSTTTDKEPSPSSSSSTCGSDSASEATNSTRQTTPNSSENGEDELEEGEILENTVPENPITEKPRNGDDEPEEGEILE